MTELTASELIRGILNDINVKHKHGSDKDIEDSVEFMLDDNCSVEVYKHEYAGGYGVKTKCKCNDALVISKASMIEQIQMNIRDNRIRLSAMSPDRTQNAAEISVSTELTNKPSDYDDGTFYIKCDYTGECSVKKVVSSIPNLYSR